MQNSRSMGRCIHHTPSKAVLGGELVVLTGMVAVASTDIPANVEGACEVVGTAWADAQANDATVLCRINFGYGVAAAAAAAEQGS